MAVQKEKECFVSVLFAKHFSYIKSDFKICMMNFDHK